MGNQPLFSIIVPVKNEEKNINRCLHQLDIQKIPDSREILVIDSGSSDRTLQLLEDSDLPGLRVRRIPPEEFGHGKTRNLGARLSRGKFLVFLNADAFPLNHQWLCSLHDRFIRQPAIVAAYSRHLPRGNCHLYMQRDICRSFPPGAKRTVRGGIFEQMIFSTVSCMIRRDFFLQFPFRDDIAIAEDQEWARRVIRENRGTIAYVPESVVIHSHNYPGKRLYEIKKAVAASGPGFHWISLLTWVPFMAGAGIVVRILGDWWYIILARERTLKNRFLQMMISFRARVCTFAGKYFGWWQSRIHKSRG